MGPEKDTVILDSWIDYLKGDMVLDRFNIWYHHTLQVFVYYSCQIDLISKMLKGYLKAKHMYTRAGKDLQDSQVFLHCHQIYRYFEDILLPSSGELSVQSLHALKPGFMYMLNHIVYLYYQVWKGDEKTCLK